MERNVTTSFLLLSHPHSDYSSQVKSNKLVCLLIVFSFSFLPNNGKTVVKNLLFYFAKYSIFPSKNTWSDSDIVRVSAQAKPVAPLSFHIVPEFLIAEFLSYLRTKSVGICVLKVCPKLVLFVSIANQEFFRKCAGLQPAPYLCGKKSKIYN